jgi:gas vesicle protein
MMWWRANDVLVGVVTGVFSAVVAALFEAFFVTARFLSLGQHGGGLGSKIFFIAIVGAIVGGIVGFFVSAVIKPRTQTR